MARSEKFAAAMEAYDEDRASDALRLMESCAADGDPVACYLAALWHRDGEGAAPDARKSEHWLKELMRLAQAGSVEAQWELSSNYRWGELLPVDLTEANHWLERAAENGWGAAQHHLAWYLETGQYGYAMNREASEMWYRRAFEQEHPETLYNFAMREFKGGRITEKAIALLTKAAGKGFKQAAHVLREHRH